MKSQIHKYILIDAGLNALVDDDQRGTRWELLKDHNNAHGLERIDDVTNLMNAGVKPFDDVLGHPIFYFSHISSTKAPLSA